MKKRIWITIGAAAVIIALGVFVYLVYFTGYDYSMADDATLDIGGNIMAISGLSFVGLGVQPPTPEWGSILSAGREFLRDFPPIVIFPAIAIGLTLFGFNILGDALRDALDPRLKD